MQSTLSKFNFGFVEFKHENNFNSPLFIFLYKSSFEQKITITLDFAFYDYLKILSIGE